MVVHITKLSLRIQVSIVEVLFGTMRHIMLDLLLEERLVTLLIITTVPMGI